MSLVMAYCDGRHAEYWDTLKSQHLGWYLSDRLRDRLRALRRTDPREHQRMTNLLAIYGVPEAFARRAHEQVWRSHEYRVDHAKIQNTQPHRTGLRGAPVPASEVMLYMNWSHPPFYGGWHSWNVGEVSHVVRRKVAQPFTGFDLFICGEAFSSDQGWIEGALRSAELVLSVNLRAAPPKWLNGLDDLLMKARYDSLDEYVGW